MSKVRGQDRTKVLTAPGWGGAWRTQLRAGRRDQSAGLGAGAPRAGAPASSDPGSPSSPPRASITLTLRVVQRLVQGHTADGAEHAL